MLNTIEHSLPVIDELVLRISAIAVLTDYRIMIADSNKLVPYSGMPFRNTPFSEIAIAARANLPKINRFYLRVAVLKTGNDMRTDESSIGG